MPKIQVIAAVSENNVIGRDGDLPWHLPEDLKRFKKLTTGHPVLMGRKTWESIPEKFRPLPGRTNILVTRQKEYDAPDGVKIYSDVNEALNAHSDEDLFVIGGGEIYRQTIDRADVIYLTRVHREIEGDSFFPEIDPSVWEETERDDRDDFSFLTYERRA